MAVSKDKLEKLLIQVRRIAEHREIGAEKEIRKVYKQLAKELKQFIGYEYAVMAQDGSLTFEILAQHQGYARFLEEVQQKVDGVMPQAQEEIRQLINDTYEASYKGMVDAAKKTSPQALRAAMEGVEFVMPEQIRAGVENTLINKILLNETLEKNRQNVIYNLKREINVGLTNGDRLDTVAKRISKVVDDDYKKAVTVARTETHRVREKGVLDGALEFDKALQNGISGMRMVKIWKTMKDERVRPKRGRGKKPAKGGANHVIMEGQAVLVDEMFTLSNGDKTTAPGQSGIASEDINCRCRLSYEPMSDEEFYELTGRHFPK